MDNTPPPPPPSSGHNPPPEPSEKLRELADSLAAKHASQPNQPKGRGGRKTRAQEFQEFLRKNNLRAIPASEQPSPEVNPQRDYAVDPAFLRKLAETALKGFEAYRQREAYLKAVAVGIERSQAREIGDGNGAPPGGIEVFCDAFAEWAAKYDWLTKWTPEMAMGICVATWVIKDQAIMRRLEAIAQEKENERKSS